MKYKSKWNRLKRLAPILVLIASFSLAAQAAVQATPQAAPAPAANNTGWEAVPLPNQITLYELDMNSPTQGWAGGTAGSVLYWNGSYWIPTSTGSDGLVTGLSVGSSSGWLCDHLGHIYRYGTTTGWQLSDSVGAWLDDITGQWAVGERGLIFTRGASGWEQYADTTLGWLDAIAFAGSSEGWIVGAGGLLRWNGVGWGGQVNLPPGTWLHGVDAVAVGEAWAVGSYGVIYHYTGSWAPVSSPTTNDLWSVVMVAADDGWIVGDHGTILRYDGSEWRIAPSPTTERLLAIDALAADDIWAVGTGDNAWHYTGAPDLSTSSKAVDPVYAGPGDTLTYTIHVRNSGDKEAPSVVVSDTLDLALVTYVPGSATTTQGGPIQGPNPLVVPVGDIAPGGEVTITYQVTVVDQGEPCWFISNEALVSMEGGEPQSRRAGTTVGEGCHHVYLPLLFH